MDKNELCKKVSAGMLLLTMSLYATPVFAYSKDETVYSKLNSEGNSYKTIVSTHLKNTDSENTLNDMTNLTNIKNTNGDEKFSQNGNSLIWDAQKHDIYYQGESENELPISCSVKYELDGEEISAKDIAGKSGKVKVTINYENKSENLVNINGKTQKLYTPFVVVAGTMINNKNNRNIDVSNGKVIDLVLPVLVLIGTAIGAMIYTGFLGGATDVVTAFAGCDAETSLIFATLITVMFMLVLYLPRKVITFKGFMDSFVEGFKMMIPAIGILIFAWSLKGMGDALEIASFVENLVGSNASASVLLPAILFLVAIFLSFSTGTSWGTFAILVPIAIAMFPGADNMQMMIIAVASVLSGAVCGDHVSPISDTTIMSSAGAQCHHIDHVSTQMQYAIVVAVVCVFGYLIAGFVQVWWIVLLISIAVLLTTLTIMKKYVNKKYLKK